MGNTSLDDFVESEESATDPAEPSETAGPSDAVESPESDAGPVVAESAGEQAVDPAVSTCDFAPDGAPCAACGEAVERQWRDDRGLVCPDCKEWSEPAR